MRVLIVGAGAVGLVYGLALKRAGADVHFFVKPKHADQARAGFVMFALNGAHRTDPIRFEGFGVVTDVEEVAASRWDQVWLAVSATAIQGPWLEEIVSATGDASVICLQPGENGSTRVGPLAGDRLVLGLIAFISYQAPLPGETRFPTAGIAFWFPPTPSPFSGPEARVRPIVDALKRGGCPAAIAEDTDRQAVFGSALLQTHVAALDAVGWSWAAARDGDYLDLAARAWREAAALGAHRTSTRAPWWTGLIRPWLARAVMWLAPRLIPIDVETYFGYHFTKVGDQTRMNMDLWIAGCRAAGLPATALDELRRRMKPEAEFDPRATLRARQV